MSMIQKVTAERLPRLRLADPTMVAQINALYRELWEPLHNSSSASAKF
jgi:hypothetical protein